MKKEFQINAFPYLGKKRKRLGRRCRTRTRTGEWLRVRGCRLEPKYECRGYEMYRRRTIEVISHPEQYYV